jgi:hypothetical protein
MIKEFKSLDHRHVEANRLELFFEHTGILKLHFGNTPKSSAQQHRWNHRQRTVLLRKYSDFLATLSIPQL